MGFIIEDGVLKKYTEEDGVTDVIIPDDVVSIGKKAFMGCVNLTSVTFPESLYYIGMGAFADCKSLTSVVIPESIKSISYETFCSCSNLTSVIFPSDLKSIGEGAFCYCTNLTGVKIPYGVTNIGKRAFHMCRGLTSFDFPDSVEHIGEEAVSWCPFLTSVTIPDSVTDIGWWVFEGCGRLKKLKIFGYTIDASDWNWDRDQVFHVLSMLERKKYDLDICETIKFQFVVQVYFKENQPEAEEYIKENIKKIMTFYIDNNDYFTVKGLLESDRFVTENNIMNFIEYAVEHTQKGGDMQIQLILMNYKNDKFPSMNPFDDIKF